MPWWIGTLSSQPVRWLSLMEGGREARKVEWTTTRAFDPRPPMTSFLKWRGNGIPCVKHGNRFDNNNPHAVLVLMFFQLHIHPCPSTWSHSRSCDNGSPTPTLQIETGLATATARRRRCPLQLPIQFREPPRSPAAWVS